MKKAEMEMDRVEYARHLAAAQTAEAEGRFSDVVDHCVKSWPHIVGMMRYAKQYESAEFSSVDSVDLALKYAPIFLDFESLEVLESLLKSRRQIDRNTVDDLSAKLSAARELMSDAYRTWEQLAGDQDAHFENLRGTLGGNLYRWQSITESWQAVGLLTEEARPNMPARLKFVTRFDSMMKAKCSNCGVVAKGTKMQFLEPRTCPKC